MPVAHTRHADPSREHADQPSSSRWTSAIALAEVSSHQRNRIPCLRIDHVHQAVHSTARYGAAWCEEEEDSDTDDHLALQGAVMYMWKSLYPQLWYSTIKLKDVAGDKKGFFYFQHSNICAVLYATFSFM
jgi:hypothetical protein